MLRRTPLFAAHAASGARLVEFGGWEMPVHYTVIVDEHLTVRQAAGLFDISHMGQVLVRGAAALAFLNHLAVFREFAFYNVLVAVFGLAVLFGAYRAPKTVWSLIANVPLFVFFASAINLS